MRFAGRRHGANALQTYDEGGSLRVFAARPEPTQTAWTRLRTRGTSMDISDWRTRIDKLDEEIVKLLCERAACAIEIGKIKQTSAAAIYEPRREQQVYDHVRAVNPGPLKGVQVQDIYERVMDVMRSLQKPGASEGERWPSRMHHPFEVRNRFPPLCRRGVTTKGSAEQELQIGRTP